MQIYFYVSFSKFRTVYEYMNQIQFMLYSRIAFNIILSFLSWDFTFIYPEYKTDFARELTNASFVIQFTIERLMNQSMFKTPDMK